MVLYIYFTFGDAFGGVTPRTRKTTSFFALQSDILNTPISQNGLKASIPLGVSCCHPTLSISWLMKDAKE